jgi:hypothetical protein
MMLGAAPIFPNLADGLSSAGSRTVLDEQAKFQQSLLQAASAHDVAPSVADRGAFVPPASEISRPAVQAGAPGERMLRSLSAIYRNNPVASVPVGGGPARPSGVKAGPAERLLLQPDGPGARVAGKQPGPDNFESTMANLRDVYNGVIQVSLVTKSTGSVSSSLNKLLSAG